MKKVFTMIGSKFEQFYHEIKAWARSLDYFKQENIELKNRLSEVVDHKTDKEFLALAEHFQNQFILKDEFIQELKHDIHEQEDLLNKENNTELLARDIKIIKRQERLRNEIEYLEKDYARLRNEFNKYLAGAL